MSEAQSREGMQWQHAVARDQTPETGVQGQRLSGNRGEMEPPSPTNTYQLLMNQPASPQAPTTSVCPSTQWWLFVYLNIMEYRH